jgi:hypothetical protein
MSVGGKVTLEDVTTLQDPLTSSLYELAFTKLPTGVPEPYGMTAGSLLRIACQSCTLPGKTIEPVDLNLHAHMLHFAGKVTFTGDMTITFVENRYMSVYNYLYDWISYIKTHKNQLGLYKEQYESRAMLRVFDQNQVTIGAFDIFGLWITTLPEITFDSENQLITIPAGFKFDYVERTEYDQSPKHIDPPNYSGSS